jgi:4-diphosphocytidyl-2-C-methyl-D-erythritol kinase
METLRLPSYAKINLGLLVKGKREDGFHEIETILHQIDLRDEIEIVRRSDGHVKMSTDHPGLPIDDGNLCVQAAKRLQLAFKVQEGAEIRLTKVIPAGAGLGGGSSNAAAVLLGLNRLWQLDLPPEELQRLAASIGADVPFFIRGGSALASGKGDTINHFDLVNSFAILVVFPNVMIPTRWAYGQFNLSLTKSEKSLTLLYFKRININNVNLLRSLRNDFEDVVFPEYPMLSHCKRLMEDAGAVYASLSGSGSALYGFFQNTGDAAAASEAFQERCQTYVTQHIEWGYREIEQDSLGPSRLAHTK